MIWLTADQHFLHENIIHYCGRPFANQGEMGKVLTGKYLSRVKPDDTVYFLGDFTLMGPESYPTVKNILRPLHGKKILILGNHDHLDPFKYVEMGFQSVHTFLELPPINIPNHGNVTIYSIHDPALGCYRDKSVIWLCGHIHNIFKVHNNIINVGVDVWDYFPVSYEELTPYVAKWVSSFKGEVCSA